MNGDTTNNGLHGLLEAIDDRPARMPANATFGDVVAKRFARRDLLKGALATSVLAALGPPSLRAEANGGQFTFNEISRGVDETHHVPDDYVAEVLIRWGDPVMADAPSFDPTTQTAAGQAKQFGYNNDFLGLAPLPDDDEGRAGALLCVNHEFTNDDLMHASMSALENPREGFTREIVDVAMAAHGGSVIEIRKQSEGGWAVKADSPYNRRISPLDTEIALSGPAAGHDRLKTSSDPTGRTVTGTLNNCAGGMTPWGTWLMAEENFHLYFWGGTEGHPEQRNYDRLGLPANAYPWGLFHKRFHVNEEPNEANRFGWIVEVDPLDPNSRPVKRTAMGRFKHEGAETIVNRDGRIVVYSGDDQRFDYLYRFVSDGSYDPDDREANRDLLDSGTLSVARFAADGTVDWIPLIFGSGPLTRENDFNSQADVLIETRRAADLLSATPMDRPEDVQPNPTTNRVYVTLTNNSKRTAAQTDPVNPRAANLWGHIVELTPPYGNHAASTFAWEILVKCGNPADPTSGSAWNPATTENGWFACPDNLAVDPFGRLWVATDQGREWPMVSDAADGVWALETEGTGRGTGRMLYRAPVGAEVCGPCFSADGTTLFVAVQHPASDGAESFKGFERKSTFHDPATRWPDFEDGMPPRPSVVAIRRKDGKPVGT